MKYAIFVLICLSGSTILPAQDFPATFLGHWEGDLEWFQTGKKTPQKVNMQLFVAPSDSINTYTWKLVYGEKNQDSRPYLIKAADSSKVHWIIDERNGILLDHYWTGNCLTGAFTVQQTTIINNFRVEGDQLIVEFYAIAAKPVRISGGSGEEVPEVSSYGEKSYQKAVLRKKKA